MYRPRKAGGKPDALTRRSGDLPKVGDEWLLANQQAVLKPRNVTDLALHSLTHRADHTQPVADHADHVQPVADHTDHADHTQPVADHADHVQPVADHTDQADHVQPVADHADHAERPATSDLFTEAYRINPLPNWILRQLEEGSRHSREISLADCKVRDNRLTYQDCIYVPDYTPLRLRLLGDHHEPPAVGHPGRAKTLELHTHKYYWLQMRKDIDHFVRNCHTCRRTKATCHALYGLLRPLPVPTQP